MNTLVDAYTHAGAFLAGDGIPLHFGDATVEAQAALSGPGVLLDRSHEARVRLTGGGRLALLHRIATNALDDLAVGEGRGTLFTTAQARIVDRAEVYARLDDTVLVGEPGRGPALAQFLARSVFYNDNTHVENITSSTHMFALHGPAANAIVASLGAPLTDQTHCDSMSLPGGLDVAVLRRSNLRGAHWTLVAEAEDALAVWAVLVRHAAMHGVYPAGSLAYNALRIAAGRPGIGRELSPGYLPLEVALWDEVSFTKGCYTGQEILARMESRGRLSRTLARVTLDSVDAPATPAELSVEAKPAGTLTSATRLPDGKVIGLAVLRTAYAHPGTTLTTFVEGHDVSVAVLDLPGAQPPTRFLARAGHDES